MGQVHDSGEEGGGPFTGCSGKTSRGEGSFELGPKGPEGDSHAKALRPLRVELPAKIGHDVKCAFQINHKHIFSVSMSHVMFGTCTKKLPMVRLKFTFLFAKSGKPM